MYKVMIVDDEPVIRKGLLCFINWQSLGCTVVYEAGNGVEARRYIEQNPVDIVIADIKMPGMDGIELSKHIYEEHPGIKVIILTAFADFSYAQLAIKYNVVDFVVKTNPTEKIPEAVMKAQNLIETQKEKEKKLEILETRITNNLSEISEKFIKDIVNGIIIDRSLIDRKARELDVNLNNYFLVAYEINVTSEETMENLLEEHNKFIYAIKNFLSLAFKDYHHYTTIMNKNMLITIVSFQNSASSSSRTQSLLVTCNEILSMTDGFMKFSLSIGISTMHKLIHELPQAYAEAYEALSESFYNDNHVSVYMPDNNAKTSNKAINIHNYSEDIVCHIQKGEHDSAISCLNNLFSEYRVNKEPIEKVKVSCMLLCSLAFRLLANYKLNIPDHAPNETTVYKQIQESKSLQGLSAIVGNAIKSISMLISSNEKQYNYLVREVNKYIFENYNLNINLQSIANHIHVNSSYLSRLYKKETGESIIDTINKYRIEVAKKLLKNPSSRVSEIAAAIGIEDPAYFTHVFAKYTGMSPKEYKSSG